jgi:hypothetical protein
MAWFYKSGRFGDNVGVGLRAPIYLQQFAMPKTGYAKASI